MKGKKIIVWGAERKLVINFSDGIFNFSLIQSLMLRKMDQWIEGIKRAIRWVLNVFLKLQIIQLCCFVFPKCQNVARINGSLNQ